MTELFKSILCPVDFDELYLDALELSKKLAQQNNAKLYVLNVMSDYRFRSWLGSGWKNQPATAR